MDRAVVSTGFYASDRFASLEIYADLIEAASYEYVERKPLLQLIENKMEQLSRFRHPITLMILPALPRSSLAVVRANAQINLQVAALAVERFRLANQQLPKTLDELVPTYLDAVPIDPFTGNPLFFITEPDGYTLYSVGMNEIDDGGAKLKNSYEGDIVLRVSH